MFFCLHWRIEASMVPMTLAFASVNKLRAYLSIETGFTVLPSVGKAN